MKKTNKVLTVIALVSVAGLWAARAQGDVAIPDELLNTNVREWQLNGVTILIIVQVLGRAYAGLSKGGGLVGLWKGIVFGTNTPKEPTT